MFSIYSVLSQRYVGAYEQVPSILFDMECQLTLL